jgi:XRE family transcriptional regulator, regulator of sulfur utilization
MPREPPDQRLAELLKKLREDRELTQEDVAYQAGISTGALSRIEGAIANPSWTTVGRIAVALGVSVQELARRTKS